MTREEIDKLNALLQTNGRRLLQLIKQINYVLS